jgi:hypothetical protein
VPGVGEARRGRAHGLAGAEVEVVGRHLELPGRHPELEQAGIDVDQGAAAEAREEVGRDAVVEVEQQVGVREHRLRAPAFDVQPGRTRARLVQPGAARHAEALHAAEEAAAQAPVAAGIASRGKGLEPVHVAAELAQPLDVLHVDPEVATTLGVARYVVGGDHDAGHAPLLPAPPTSRKLASTMPSSSTRRRTPASRRARSSSSRSVA